MLIVGLGNPDKKYENTYHNVGFMVVDKIAEILGEKFKNKECKSVTATRYVAGERLVIAKPQTYMNLSGEAVTELIGKYHQELENVIIIFDDIDLDCGELRMRCEGSGGTHNGMKNIVMLLNNKTIPRIRIGIGKPTPPMLLADYVLSQIRGENADKLDNSIERASNAIVDYIKHKEVNRLMREINNNDNQ